jgi:hypothetical protein
MNHMNCLLAARRGLFERAFLLIFPGLILATTPIHAQTEQTPDPPACARPASTETSELFLADAPAQDCSRANSRVPLRPTAPGSAITQPPAPVQSQTTLTNHRLFGVLANYTTVETQDQFGTLPVPTKFKLTAKTMTDPITVSFIGAIALLGQARNSDPSYGQGFAGYDKRFATFYADTGIGTLMTSSVFPTVLHQDPRYFQLGHGGFRRRFLHAVAGIFVARSDGGELQFNYSQIVGNAVAAGISNTYHPENQRTLGNTLNVWGTDTLLNMLCNVAKEFWPDIRRKLHKQKDAS